MHFERDESNDQQNSKKLQCKQNKEKLKFTERKEGTGRHCQHRGRWEEKTDAVQTIPCGPRKVLSQPKSHQLSSSSSSSSSSISYLIHHHQHNNQKSLHCDDCHQIMMIIVTIMVCCVDIHTLGEERTQWWESRDRNVPWTMSAVPTASNTNTEMTNTNTETKQIFKINQCLYKKRCSELS